MPTSRSRNQLDWDLYQGQAPVHDYCLQRTHANFRWWYEYAGGIITDWGNHHMDIAHWGMDCELTGPTSVEARGCSPTTAHADCYNTPDRFFSRMVYPNGVGAALLRRRSNEKLLYGAVEQASADHAGAGRLALRQGCTRRDQVVPIATGSCSLATGRVFVNRGGVYGKAAEQLDDRPAAGRRLAGSRRARTTWRNFFECVADRDEPVSPVRIQHRTVTACHLTNISLRLGRQLQWDPDTQQIVGDDQVQRGSSASSGRPMGSRVSALLQPVADLTCDTGYPVAMESIIQKRTACNRDCPDACGIVATVHDGRVVRLQGDADHPVTRGFLCHRTSRFLDRHYSADRLTEPLVRDGDGFRPAAWDECLDRIAATMLRFRDESGAASILQYRCGGSLGMMKHVGDYFFQRFGPVTVKSGDVCSGAGEAAQTARLWLLRQ